MSEGRESYPLNNFTFADRLMMPQRYDARAFRKKTLTYEAEYIARNAFFGWKYTPKVPKYIVWTY